MGRTLAYACVAVALIVFGAAGLFSIGAPFLLTGLAMIVCFPWRHRRAILWPAIAGVWGFTLGYVLLAPIGCTQSGGSEGLRLGPVGIAARTTCNGILFDYAGGTSYSPPLLPSVVLGIAAAAGAVLAVRAILRKRTPDPFEHRSSTQAD